MQRPSPQGIELARRLMPLMVRLIESLRAFTDAWLERAGASDAGEGDGRDLFQAVLERGAALQPSASNVLSHDYGKGYELLVKSGWREGQFIGKSGAVPYAGPAFEDTGRPRGAHAPDDMTGIGWAGEANDRYCWPPEFVQDVPRPAPPSFRFSSWWRPGTAATVAECVSAVVTDRSWSTHALTEVVPQPGSAQPGVHETQFFSDASCVVKLYRICAAGEALHDKWRLRHAVDACIDASATDYMRIKDPSYVAHYSFGLVCNETAYVCVVRPHMTDCGHVPSRILAEWHCTSSARTGVALNDWQRHTTGLYDGGFGASLQARDFGRAARCRTGFLPSATFIQDYMEYCQRTGPGKGTVRLELVSTLRRSGLDEVYEFFAEKWRDGVAGFGLSFDAAMFERAPLCQFG
jgi:hypothetical protein